MANNTDNKLKFIFRLLPVVGLAFLIAGFIWAINQARFDNAAYGAIGVGVLLFLTLFVKAEVANLKYYLHVFVYSILVLGVCVVGYLFTRQYTKKVDLTEQKMYSLSPQSDKYLKRLDKDVKITIFFQTTNAFNEIIDLYKGATDKLKWQVLDARTHPLEARQFGDTVRNGDMFVQAGEKKKRLQVAELQDNYENTLTNAIVEVTRSKNIKLYFLSGHGEIAYERPAQPTRRGQEGGEASLGAFREFLSQRAIETGQLDLGKTGSVPEDASMVIIAGPKNDLLPAEAQALKGYLQKNGKLLVLLDIPQQNFTAPFANIKGLLTGYGVEVPDKIIVDMYSRQLGASPVQPLAAWFDPSHPITRDLGNRSSRFLLSITRPIEAAPQPPGGLQATVLIKSSDASWSENIAKVVSGQIAPPSRDQLKAQPMAVAVSQGAPQQQMPGMPPPPAGKSGLRLVVFGTSELIQDTFLSSNQGAVELMLNTVNWLSEQEDMIAVPPRQLKGTPIILDPAQLRVIFALTAVLIPALLFFGGISYSLVRRRR